MDVYCCFLGATSELLEDHYLNRGAAWASPPTVSGLPPKVHVELLFVPTEQPVKTLRLGHKVYKDVELGAAKHKRASRFDDTRHQEAAPGSLRGVACSILYGSTVHVNEDKSFSRRNWEFRKMKCTKEQAKNCLQWMRDHETEGFNKAGFFTEPFRRKLSCVPFAPMPNLFQPTSFLQLGHKKWYCSELVEAALRETGIVKAGQTTPSAHPEILFQELKNMSLPSAPIARGEISF